MTQVQSSQDVAQPLTAAGVASGPLQSGLQNTSLNSPSDEIDLVELVAFFWKIKIEIFVGALIGLVIGGVVGFRFLSTNYRSDIPLMIDRNEKTALDSALLLTMYNNEINASGNARQIWRSVFNQSPELARVLREAEIDDDALARAQAMADKPEKAPLRLRAAASSRDFILEVQLPVRGLPARSSEIFASAIQTTLMTSSGNDDSDKETLAKPATADASSVATSQVGQDEYKSELREQLLRSRQELLKIEYLCSKLSRGLTDASLFLGDGTAKSLQVAAPTGLDGAVAQEVIGVQGQFERIQRMTAVLLAEGRMKPEDANDTIMRAMQARDDIIQLIPEVRKETVKMFNQNQLKRSAARGEIRAGMPSELLPLLLPASMLMSANDAERSGNQLKFEKPTSSRKVAPVLGAFLGAFLGFAVGGLRVFLRRNVQRLREVLG